MITFDLVTDGHWARAQEFCARFLLHDSWTLCHTVLVGYNLKFNSMEVRAQQTRKVLVFITSLLHMNP